MSDHPERTATEVELRRALNEIAWECDPEDCAWTEPAAARRFIWERAIKVIGRPIDPGDMP